MKPSCKSLFAVLGPLALGALSGTACSDPVQDDALTALGPEDPKVKRGPDHRPGQPCLVCHGEAGEGPEMVVAGTVYAGPTDPTPMAGIDVEVTDARGSVFRTTTRRSGNFYLEKKKARPVVPIRVRLVRGAEETVMVSRIGRTGSCADCHRGTGSRASMPIVYWRPQ
jgi:hypothetical protein